MNNNQYSANAISHKELKALLKKAKKEDISINSSNNNENHETEEFNDLITSWTEISKKILLKMNKNDQVLTKNKNSKSLMAFGAMGAHINMALQALKATESDQWKLNNNNNKFITYKIKISKSSFLKNIISY